MTSTTFSNDADGDGADPGTASASGDGDEYVFEGFKVMFAEKVMLTAAGEPAPAAPDAPSMPPQSRRLH